MDLNYRYSESTEKQESIETNNGTVYIRKDFAEEDRTSMGNTVHFYTYKEAKLTQEEYDAYSRDLVVANAMNNTDAPINQQCIMAAISDLYDMVSKLTNTTTTT